MKSISFLGIFPVYADEKLAKNSDKDECLSLPLVKSTSMIKLMALIALSLELSACFPYPHRFIDRQEMGLFLVHGKQPVSNTKVYVARGVEMASLCKNHQYIGLTDKNGFVGIEKEVSLDLFYSLINPPERIMSVVHICVQRNGDLEFGYSVAEKTDKPRPYIEIHCDLQKPKVRSVLGNFGFSCEKKYKE